MFGPVNHEQNWEGWERSGEKADNQAETCLIITINAIGYFHWGPSLDYQ
jgi:hypothetical protein